MKFHAAILQTTGQVSQPVRRDSEAMSCDSASPKISEARRHFAVASRPSGRADSERPSRSVIVWLLSV